MGRVVFQSESSLEIKPPKLLFSNRVSFQVKASIQPPPPHPALATLWPNASPDRARDAEFQKGSEEGLRQSSPPSGPRRLSRLDNLDEVVYSLP